MRYIIAVVALIATAGAAQARCVYDADECQQARRFSNQHWQQQHEFAVQQQYQQQQLMQQQHQAQQQQQQHEELMQQVRRINHSVSGY